MSAPLPWALRALARRSAAHTRRPPVLPVGCGIRAGTAPFCAALPSQPLEITLRRDWAEHRRNHQGGHRENGSASPRGSASLQPGAGCLCAPQPVQSCGQPPGGSRDGAGAAQEGAGTGGQLPGVSGESPGGQEPIVARDDKKRRGGLLPTPAATYPSTPLPPSKQRELRAGRSVLRICHRVIHAVRPAHGWVTTPLRFPPGCRPLRAAPYPALPLGSAALGRSTSASPYLHARRCGG